MRILFLITKSEIGGAQKNVLLISRGLKKEGFDICVGSGEKGYLTDELGKSGINTVFFKNLKRTSNLFANCFFIFELRKFFKKENFDLVSFNSTNTLFGVLSMLGLKNKPKTVFTVHGSSFLSLGFKKSKILKMFFLLMMKFFLPFVDRVIFVSEYDKKLAENYKLIKDGQGIVIHNGIENIDFFNKEEALKKLKEIKNFPNDKFVMGTITRLEYAKGNSILIDAVSRLSKEILDKCVCLIIGDGPDKENLKFQISNLKLQDKIFLLGDISDAKKYLKAFDIFIMTSRYEGMPYALLEAMSANLPIISSRVGGIPELLGDSGMMFEANNIDDFISNLTNLANNQFLRDELSKKTSLRIKNFFFPEKLKEMKNIFIFLVGSR
ncbi:MAG: glycosyltransferase [Patescibacteria group bacterium]